MLVVGMWGITRQNTMWRDEAATWQVSRRSVPEICHLLSHVDVVHGLYYLLMHGVFTLFGESLFALRLPSVLAMAAAATITAKIGAQLSGVAGGLCAGSAVALIPAIQNYAQEGRSYALVAAGVAYATWLLIGALKQPAGARRWVAYGVTVLVTAWLNWFALSLLLAHAWTVCSGRTGRDITVRWGAASAAALAGTLPLVIFSQGQSGQVSWIKPLSLVDLTVPGVVITAGTLCALTCQARPTRVSLRAVALPLLAVPQVTLLAVSLIKPLYIDRYILFSHLGLALLIGVVGARVHHALRRPWLVAAVGMGVVALGSVLLPTELRQRGPQSRVDDVIAPADVVAATARAGDGILFIPAARRDTALVSPRKFTGLDDLALQESPAASGTLKGVEKSPERIYRAAVAHQRVILVTDADGASTAAGDRAKQRALADHFVCVSDQRVHGRRVAVYQRH
ncbi:hypothetical protein ACGFW5_15285 [Streptomyces sp. NPDC048416]|uniref:glycosyltransferase family 39 protein n=1 Tax=Streptomyces sp. NPDC048416 TaxID=3365546 RepID=UPI00371BA322